MRDILQQVMQIPGAIGALTYGSDGRILASEFPGQYEASSLQRMTRLLSEDFLVQQAISGEKGGLDLKYSGGRIVIRPFSGGAILALCAQAANTQLVNLALMQAVHRIEKLATDEMSRPAPMPEDSSKPVAKPVQRVAADLINPSVLAALKQAFLVRIGPIGEMLFTRIYSDWSSEPGAGISGLGTLVTRIASEIDDPADQKAFLHEVRNVIG